MSRVEIAIIGFGASGVNVLRQLVKHKKEINYSKIYIIQDIKRQFGTGLPYQNDHETLLLNVYPNFMSLNTENKDEFKEYLKENRIDFEPYDFLPREVFGQYVKSIYCDAEAKEDDIEVIYDEAIAIELDGDDYIISLKNGENLTVQSVQLTIGHLAYNDPYDLKGNTQYIHNPYPMKEKLDVIEPHHKVAIIGAGLSALDFLMYLKRNDRSREVDLFSLEGLAKTARGKNFQDVIELNYLSAKALTALADELDRPLTAVDIMTQFEKEATELGVDFDYFWYNRPLGTIDSLKLDFEEMDQLNTLQTIIVAFKNEFNVTWDRLSEEEKKALFDEHKEKLGIYGAPIPSSRAKDVIEFSEEGSLRIYSDSKEATFYDGQFTLKTDEKEYSGYDYLINATGQSLNVEKDLENQSTLVKQLVHDNIAEPYQFGGFKVDYPSFSLIHPDRGILPTFKVYGQLSSGVDVFNNSIAKLSVSTQQGTEALAEYCKSL